MDISNYLISGILETISEAVVFHAPDGEIQYVNKQAETILGLTRDQILGKTPMDPQWRTFKEDMSAFKAEDHPSTYTLQTQKAMHNVIMGIYKGDGSFVWININSKPLFKDEKFLGAALSFSDVTKEVEQTKMIKIQSRYLEMILESTPIVLYALNKEGDFTYSKGSGLKPLGLKDDQVVGLSVYDVYAGNDVILNTIDDCLKHGNFHEYQTQVGDQIYSNYIVPTHDIHGGVEGVMGFGFNITENERNKKTLVLQARQAQIGEMLSVISHQWRQPLTAISTNLVQMRLLLELGNNDIDTFKSLLQKSETTITHLSETINYFRDFFKPDENRELVNVRQIIESVMELMHDILTTHNVKLILGDKLRDASLYSYHHDLSQIFMNLFSNVVDIAKEKQMDDIEIVIGCYEENNALIIEVQDNAGGIPEGDLENIFTPYFTTKGNLQGTGLGLYMCKNIIEDRCNGMIKAFNRSGGAVFQIHLPLK